MLGLDGVTCMGLERIEASCLDWPVGFLVGGCGFRFDRGGCTPAEYGVEAHGISANRWWFNVGVGVCENSEG